MEIVDRRYCTRKWLVALRQQSKTLTHVLRISGKCLMDVRRSITALRQFGDYSSGCWMYFTQVSKTAIHRIPFTSVWRHGKSLQAAIVEKNMKCLSGNNLKKIWDTSDAFPWTVCTDVRRCIAALCQFGDDGYECRMFSTQSSKIPKVGTWIYVSLDTWQVVVKCNFKQKWEVPLRQHSKPLRHVFRFSATCITALCQFGEYGYECDTFVIKFSKTHIHRIRMYVSLDTRHFVVRR